MKKYVVGPGAAGQHWILSVLKDRGQDILPLSGRTGGGHSKNQEDICRLGSLPANVLYVYSHPIDTMFSFYRRDFFKNDKHFLGVNGVKYKSFISFVNSNMHVQDPNEFFENYIKNGVKYMDLLGHWNSWLDEKNSISGISVSGLKYESIPEKWHDACDWLGIPDGKEGLDTFRKRTDYTGFVSPEMMSMLKHFFAEEIQEYERRPGFFTVGK